MIVLDLQRFAGDKTEKATPKKRSEARKKGSVAKSKDLASAIVFLFMLYVLKMFGSRLWNGFENNWSYDFAHAGQGTFTQQGILSLVSHQIMIFANLVYPLVLIPMVVGLLSNFLQVKFMFLPNLLMPKFERINPLSGLKRIFSINGLVTTGQSIFKLGIIIGFVYLSVHGLLPQIETLIRVKTVDYPNVIGNMIFGILMKVAVGLLLLSVIDYIYQKFKFEKDMKMSKDEVKDERKQMDGNTEVKGKIRQKGRELASRRMMQNVPNADVIVTNPTHFSVALQYKKGTSAPIVLAKGQDETAFRIREVAKEHNVPIVENKPLARELYRVCEIDDTVPVHLFKAVAKLLAEIYRMKNGRVRR